MRKIHIIEETEVSIFKSKVEKFLSGIPRSLTSIKFDTIPAPFSDHHGVLYHIAYIEYVEEDLTDKIDITLREIRARLSISPYPSDKQLAIVKRCLSEVFGNEGSFASLTPTVREDDLKQAATTINPAIQAVIDYKRIIKPGRNMQGKRAPSFFIEVNQREIEVINLAPLKFMEWLNQSVQPALGGDEEGEF